MLRYKKIILLLLFLKFTTASVYPQQVKNISVNSIKEKELFYKDLFDTNKKIKKAALVSIGAAFTIFTSYKGFQLWKNIYSKSNDVTENTNIATTDPINTTNE
jgi:hypothetical protein